MILISPDLSSLMKEELLAEATKMQLRISSLEEELTKSRTKLDDIIHSNPAVIYTCKAEGDFGATFISGHVKEQFGYDPEEFTENSNFWGDGIHPDDRERVFRELEAVFEHGHVEYEYRFRKKSGDYIWVRDESRLNYDADGKPKEIAGYWIDINDKRLVQEKLAKLVEAQEGTIRELTTPVLEIWDEVLVLPLVGTVDTLRAQQIIEVLLETIVKTQAAVAILDVTGVPVIDTAVANHLIKTIEASRMLGADVIVTGVNPENAQTLVKLGVDLTKVTAKSSLKVGLKLALQKTNGRA